MGTRRQVEQIFLEGWLGGPPGEPAVPHPLPHPRGGGTRLKRNGGMWEEKELELKWHFLAWGLGKQGCGIYVESLQTSWLVMGFLFVFCFFTILAYCFCSCSES